MKVAIVTGALGGIGKASALGLIQIGYHVVGMGRKDNPDLTDFNSLPFTYVSGDVSVAEDREKLFETAKSL